LKSRKKKLLLRAGLIVVLYLALSWSAFLLPPRFEIDPGVPPAAEDAVREFCRESDYLYEHPWGIPASRFYAEPFTHRELREGKIVVHLLPSGKVTAISGSTEIGMVFLQKDGKWKPDYSLMLDF
jgi:hypothetical protein